MNQQSQRDPIGHLLASLDADTLATIGSRSTFGLNDQSGLAFLERPTLSSATEDESSGALRSEEESADAPPLEERSTTESNPSHLGPAEHGHRFKTERASFDMQLNKIAHSINGVERFNVNSSIGEGTYGKIWHVNDRDLKRSVAIKTFKGSTEEAQSACREEVKFVGRLEHPSIPTVHDMGITDDGQPFLVMKLLDGESLDAIIDRLRAGDQHTHKKYSFIKRADLIMQLLRVLSSAHQAGVLHRDIKPENILVSADGDLSLIDWGCAVDVREVSEKSLVCGTPLFMSPEQILGRGLSAASDLFAVGGVAYELFSLHPPAPTEGSLDQVLRAVLTYQPQPVDLMPHPAQGYAPSEFQLAVMTALKRDPAERPQSAQEMMEMIQCSLDGEIVVICPRTRLKSLVMRFNRWLDHDPYKTVPRFYLILLASILSLIGFGMALGALIFAYIL